jgi:hypothetical protein
LRALMLACLGHQALGEALFGGRATPHARQSEIT